MSRHMWKGYISHRQTAKAQASLRIRAVSPKPSLFSHTIKGHRGSFRQRATSVILLSGRACAFKGFQTAYCYIPFSHEMAQIMLGPLQRQHDGRSYILLHPRESSGTYIFRERASRIYYYMTGSASPSMDSGDAEAAQPPLPAKSYFNSLFCNIKLN